MNNQIKYILIFNIIYMIFAFGLLIYVIVDEKNDNKEVIEQVHSYLDELGIKVIEY